MLFRGTIPLLMVLSMLAGCGKDAPRREEDTESSGSQPQEQRTRPKPFSPTAPPPLAVAPSGSAGEAPTDYTLARVGMKALYRVSPERGGRSRQSIEIVRTDAANVYARQTVTTAKYGQFVQDLSFNRFIEAAPATDTFNPNYRETYVGDRLVKVGTKKLLCRVYEVKRGQYVYRTLRCDEVPSRIVQYSDNAAGLWKTRLQLLDVWD